MLTQPPSHSQRATGSKPGVPRTRRNGARERVHKRVTSPVNRLPKHVLAKFGVGGLATLLGLVFLFFPELHPQAPPVTSKALVTAVGITSWNVRLRDASEQTYQVAAPGANSSTNGFIVSVGTDLEGQREASAPFGMLYKWNVLSVYWTMYKVNGDMDLSRSVEPGDPAYIGSKLKNAFYTDVLGRKVSASRDTDVAEYQMWVPVPPENGVFHLDVSLRNDKIANGSSLSALWSHFFRCSYQADTSQYECGTR